MDLKYHLILLCMGVLVTITCAAPNRDMGEESLTSDKVQSLEEEEEEEAEESTIDDEEDMDPRLRRKKRQAVFPYYYPAVYSTRSRRRSRNRLAYPYLYNYYTYPYYNYPYYYPYNYYQTGTFPLLPPTTNDVFNSVPAASTTNTCGCAVSDIDCLSNCYYNQYLLNQQVG